METKNQSPEQSEGDANLVGPRIVVQNPSPSGDDKRILTTNEIFQESMKLSTPAYEEKGEKLEEYKKWLKKKWRAIEEETEQGVISCGYV